MSTVSRLRGALASTLRETPVSAAITGASDAVRNLQSILTAKRLRKHRRGAAILLYHGVVPKVRDPFVEAAHIDATLFRKQIRHLKRHYRIVSLEEIVEARRGGRALPDDWVALTFDDGYRNNLECARQILRDEGRLPMSVFVVTELMGSNLTIPTVFAKMLILYGQVDQIEVPSPSGEWVSHSLSNRNRRANAYWMAHAALRALSPADQQAAVTRIRNQLGDGEAEEIRAGFESFDWLSWEEIRELHRDGVTIGSHTCSHVSMRAELGEARLRQEIFESRDRITRELGSPPKIFVYPFGAPEDVSSEATALVEEAGYDAALTTSPGTIERDSSIFELPRLIGCVQSMGAFRSANASGLRAGNHSAEAGYP